MMVVVEVKDDCGRDGDKKQEKDEMHCSGGNGVLEVHNRTSLK